MRASTADQGLAVDASSGRGRTSRARTRIYVQAAQSRSDALVSGFRRRAEHSRRTMRSCWRTWRRRCSTARRSRRRARSSRDAAAACWCSGRRRSARQGSSAAPLEDALPLQLSGRDGGAAGGHGARRQPRHADQRGRGPPSHADRRRFGGEPDALGAGAARSRRWRRSAAHGRERACWRWPTAPGARRARSSRSSATGWGGRWCSPAKRRGGGDAPAVDRSHRTRRSGVRPCDGWRCRRAIRFSADAPGRRVSRRHDPAAGAGPERQPSSRSATPTVDVRVSAPDGRMEQRRGRAVRAAMLRAASKRHSGRRRRASYRVTAEARRGGALSAARRARCWSGERISR